MSGTTDSHDTNDKEGAGLKARALHLLRCHPQITHVGDLQAGTIPRAFTVEIHVAVPLPNAWMAVGCSPKGVRGIEPVRLRFFSRYPLLAPQAELRPDFDRSLAHVMPAGPDKPPIPCLYDGKLSELMQQRGLGSIIDQLVAWLEKAALGKLIDPEQGWEPVRRDSLNDFVVTDSAKMRARVTPKGGHQAHRMEWVRFGSDQAAPYHCEIGDPMTLHFDHMDDVFGHTDSPKGDMAFGKSVALVVWPGKDKSGKPHVADKYQPESVTDIESLKARAAEYGCQEGLRSALDWFARCLDGKKGKRRWPAVIMLMARRPHHMIGHSSDIELCPYLMHIEAPKLLGDGDKTEIRPMGNQEAISPELLRRMSADTEEKTPRWVLLGAGSAGSKIAVHMARSGRNPELIVDSGFLSPHNAARHGLIPPAGMMRLTWMGPKALNLADALEGFGPRPEWAREDITHTLQDEELRKRLLPAKAWGVVNTTASLVVRQALTMLPARSPRVIEAALMAQGSVGLMTIEGPERNPGTGELFAELYEVARQDRVLRARIFAQDALTAVRVGDGCGSMTMAMSDAVLSTMTAPMAAALTRLQKEGLPQTGSLLLGTASDDQMSVSWQRHEVPAYLRLAPEDRSSWRVHVSERARAKIEAEQSHWKRVETGGILLGNYSESSRTFIVVDVMEAPPDSKRSAAEFVLGTEGIHAALTDYTAQSNHCLYCIGTWHSHLGDFGASPKDMATAAVAAVARPAPSVFLIRTPRSYRAVIADGAMISDLLDEDQAA